MTRSVAFLLAHDTCDRDQDIELTRSLLATGLLDGAWVTVNDEEYEALRRKRKYLHHFLKEGRTHGTTLIMVEDPLEDCDDALDFVERVVNVHRTDIEAEAKAAEERERLRLESEARRADVEGIVSKLPEGTAFGVWKELNVLFKGLDIED